MLNSDMFSYRIHELYMIQTFTMYMFHDVFFFVKVQVTEKSCLIINIYFLTISTLLLLFLAQGEMKIHVYKQCATF